MNTTLVLKALSDETRFKLLKLLLERSYCVRALARLLNVSEATVSQHLKVLKDADLVVGKKTGYFMHYDVQKETLVALVSEITNLVGMERVICSSDISGCPLKEQEKCRHKGQQLEK